MLVLGLAIRNEMLILNNIAVRFVLKEVVVYSFTLYDQSVWVDFYKF